MCGFRRGSGPSSILWMRNKRVNERSLTSLSDHFGDEFLDMVALVLTTELTKTE